MHAGDFSVALDEARELDEDITMRRLTLTRTRGGDGGKAAGDPREAPRLVCHYQYHAWPDHGIPETTRPLRRLAHLLVSMFQSTNAKRQLSLTRIDSANDVQAGRVPSALVTGEHSPLIAQSDVPNTGSCA